VLACVSHLTDLSVFFFWWKYQNLGHNRGVCLAWQNTETVKAAMQKVQSAELCMQSVVHMVSPTAVLLFSLWWPLPIIHQHITHHQLDSLPAVLLFAAFSPFRCQQKKDSVKMCKGSFAPPPPHPTPDLAIERNQLFYCPAHFHLFNIKLVTNYCI
jgi:hypothetical protein